MRDNDSFLNPHKTQTRYSDGEFPTAAKLTGSEVERSNAIHLLERAIGAMHRSVGTLPSPNIVNIARAIGNMAEIEPPLGGFEGSPENPQLAYMLRDATYNTIPHPNQATDYDPNLDDVNGNGVHIMCEVGCIYDCPGNSDWPKRCKKGYLDVKYTGGANYKHVCGNITTVEGLSGVCQNAACPDWSGKPLQVSYPDSDSETGTVSDILRRYKIVFPKESRLVDRPVIRDYIDCGTALGESRRHEDDEGGTGVTQSGSLSPEETFGKQSIDESIIYKMGGEPETSSNLFQSQDGDTFLIVEVPNYYDMDAGVSITRKFMVSIRPSNSSEWVELGHFTTDGVEAKKSAFPISLAYTENGKCQVRVAFYNDGDVIPATWSQVRVSRLWIDVIEINRRHRNYGRFIELPHDLANVIEDTPYPGNSIYLFDNDASIQHIVDDMVAYSAVFQRRYDSGTKTSVHLDNMNVYLYQDQELQVANNRYYTIATGCSVSEAAGAILSELIRHAGDTNMHISPDQICHALYDPSVCCSSEAQAEFNRLSTPYALNIIGVGGAGNVVEARRYYTYKVVKRGSSEIPSSIFWYKATWDISALGWTLEELGQGDEIMVSFWDTGPASLLAIMKSDTVVDQNGDPVYTHDIMPLWVTTYQGGDWYIEATAPTEFQSFDEGDTVTIAVRAMQDGSMISVPDSQLYIELFCWYYDETTQSWGWHSYPSGAISHLSSAYGTLSEYTVDLDLPSDAENYHWGVGIGWVNLTSLADKYAFVHIVIGDEIVTEAISQAPSCNLVSSFMATQVPLSGSSSAVWNGYWPDRGQNIFFPTLDQWTTPQLPIAAKDTGYAGYIFEKVNGTLLAIHSRVAFEFNLDSTDTEKVIAQASNRGYFDMKTARLIVTPKEISNYSTTGYAWSNPSDSSFVEDNNEGFCGFFVGVFLGYVLDEDICEAYRQNVPNTSTYDYTRWKGYDSIYSWGVERGWQLTPGINWSDNIPKTFDINAGCWTQPSCKYPDTCCGPGGCEGSGQDCAGHCDGGFDLGSFAYDLYTRRTLRYSPDVVPVPYGGMGSDCWNGFVANRMLTTIKLQVSARTMQPDTPMMIDVKDELSGLIREFASEINQEAVRNHSGTPGTYRFKVGFWLAPAWRHPVTKMATTTSRDTNNEWQTSLSGGWGMYNRTVEFYTRHNGTATQAPRLLLSYIVD